MGIELDNRSAMRFLAMPSLPVKVQVVSLLLGSVNRPSGKH